MQITEEDCSFLTAEKVKQILVFRRDLYCLSGRRRSMSRGRWGRIYRPGDRGLTNGRRGEGAGAEVVGVAAAGVFALLAADYVDDAAARHRGDVGVAVVVVLRADVRRNKAA